MKKRKTGFTLIELLAVIVILAIIALIATPIILNIIEKARKEAFRDTAYGIINAAELQYTEGIMDSKVEEKLYTFPQSGEDKLKFSGAEPKGGDVKISTTGKVSIAIHNGDWCVTKEENETDVTVEEYTGECSLEPSVVYTDESCFTFDSTTGTITDYSDTCPKDVAIPKTIGGVDVVEIYGGSGPGVVPAFYNKGLTSVIIPSSVKVIYGSAFSRNQLTSVIIGDGVTYIGDYAFSNNKISSVIIPESVTYIGWASFSENQLTSVAILASAETIWDFAFASNQLTSVVIPDGITHISNSAFLDNQLTSVTIPDSVTEIGSYAFGNNQLASVEIPDSVTSIGDAVFNDNQLPDKQAFIYARNSDGSIDNSTIVSYGGAKRSNVIIPEGVTTIGWHAFSGNELTSVKIPESLESIGLNAFYDNQLTSVIIPESVIEIQSNAFGNNQLTSVRINGKDDSSDFESYPSSTPFGWAEGFSDDNITWGGTGA